VSGNIGGPKAFRRKMKTRLTVNVFIKRLFFYLLIHIIPGRCKIEVIIDNDFLSVVPGNFQMAYSLFVIKPHAMRGVHKLKPEALHAFFPLGLCP
jgi:hypothetical protein